MIEIFPFIGAFLISYIGVSIVGFGLYLIISKVRGTSPWDEVEVRHNVSYQITSRFLPLINLIFWVVSAWFYFSFSEATLGNALLVGTTWLVVAAALDYIAFILIKHPLSVDHKGFYIDQIPWIYLTYVAVFISPIVFVALFG